jgi:hypothetical protein
MTRYHAKVGPGHVPNELIAFTDEEETAADSEDAALEASAASRNAKYQIREIETVPRRIRESLIALGTEDQVILDEDAAIATERGKL